MTDPETLLTVGVIARRLGRALHRVEYFIRSRSIRPASWAGHARVFRDTDLVWIASEFDRMDRDRTTNSVNSDHREGRAHDA